MVRGFCISILIFFSSSAGAQPNPNSNILNNLIAAGAVQKKDAEAINKALGANLNTIFASVLSPQQTKVIKIVRYQEGIPFYQKAQKKRKALSTAKKKKIERNYQKKLAANERSKAPVKDLPNCAQDTSQVTERKNAAQRDGRRIFYDVLYVREGAISQEIIKANPKIDIREFNAQSQSAPTLIALDQRIPCLPYRVRVTGKNVEKRFGEDAIKDLLGEGEKR